MNRKEIVQRIETIKRDIGNKNCELIRKKANEREYQIFAPNRLRFLRRLIEKLRRRLAIEVAHIFQLELDKQREINLRLLKEIQEIKKALPPQPYQRPDAKAENEMHER